MLFTISLTIRDSGWSTSVLTSRGELHVAGLINHSRNGPGSNREPDHWSLLRFPVDRSLSPRATTIAQFSSGRSHILALSDSGEIWQWGDPLGDKEAPAYQVKFHNIDLAEDDDGTNFAPKVKTVVAGWDRSTAYVAGEGLLVWQSTRQNVDEYHNTILVNAHTIPRTSFQRSVKDPWKFRDDEIGNTIGEIISHVVLEHFIVFLSDLGKVFAVNFESGKTIEMGPLELEGFDPSENRSNMKDIQGSFRSFAVFNTDGDIIIGNVQLLRRQWAATYTHELDSLENMSPQRPPGLQNRDIISLAFGDHHMHALTASGKLISFGTESQGCGSLGLGGLPAGGYLRGLHIRRRRIDQMLHYDIKDKGREIWFSPEQREWLRFMSERTYRELDHSLRMAPIQARLSEQIEAIGSDWDLHPDLDNGVDEMWGIHQPAYFTLSIAAAGWHSAALVLVNKSRVSKMYRSHAGFIPRELYLEPWDAITPQSSRPLGLNIVAMARLRENETARAQALTTRGPIAEGISDLARRAKATIYKYTGLLDDSLAAETSLPTPDDDHVQDLVHEYYLRDSVGSEFLPACARHGISLEYQED